MQVITSHSESCSPNNPARAHGDIKDNQNTPIPNNPGVCKDRLAGSEQFFATLPACFFTILTKPQTQFLSKPIPQTKKPLTERPLTEP